jgi:autotransporter passenger strand-loop-strand repeat protein
MANPVWNGASGPGAVWSNAADWSTNPLVPQPGDNVSIPSGAPVLDTTTGNTSVASVNVANIANWGIKDPGHTVTISGNLQDDGGIGVGNTFLDAGGTILNIGGTLTVTNGGAGLAIGNLAQGGTDTTVSAGSVANTGTITLNGDTTVSGRAILNVGSVAGFGGQAGVLTGNVDMASKALLEFASGQITTIAQNATLALGTSTITGANAFVADVGSTTSNSALTGLTTISGLLKLQAGATVVTSGGVTTTSSGGSQGNIEVDVDFLGVGGSLLTIGGALTNSVGLTIGRSAMSGGDAVVSASSITGGGSISLNGDTNAVITGKLIVGSTAGYGSAGHIGGNIQMQGQSLLQFASGQISTIDYPANVVIDGTHTFIADAGSITSNSALTGVTNVYGFFSLEDGASLSTSGGVTVSDPNVFHFTGIDVDQSGSGGGVLHVGGALTFNPGGGMTIGNGGIGSSTVVTANAIDFNSGGGNGITIIGNTTSGSTHQATLSIASSAGTNGVNGVWAGNNLSLQGDSLLDFTSGGGISSTAFGANIVINGAHAFIATGAATTSNSALNTLSTLGGDLALHNGAAIATGGGLTVGDGTHGANLDADSGAGITVSGALSILANNCTLGIGGGADSVSTQVTVASLVNSGTVTINGTSTSGVHGSLKVTGATTGSGNYNLTSNALLEFGGAATGGAINLGTAGGTLQIDTTTMPTNLISSFVVGDAVDLAGLAFASGGSSHLTVANVLSVTENALTVSLGLDFAQSFVGHAFVLAKDSGSGTLVTQVNSALTTTGTVLSGQTGSNIGVASGGLLVINSGGFVLSSTISSGGSAVVSGSATIVTVLSGGGAYVASGAYINSATVSNGGTEFVSSGGSTLNAVLVGNGTQIVSAGGTASNTTMSGGVQYDYGSAVSTTISSGGQEFVYGTASGTTVSSGGYDYIGAGGAASGTTVVGGGAELCGSRRHGERHHAVERRQSIRVVRRPGFRHHREQRRLGHGALRRHRQRRHHQRRRHRIRVVGRLGERHHHCPSRRADRLRDGERRDGIERRLRLRGAEWQRARHHGREWRLRVRRRRRHHHRHTDRERWRRLQPVRRHRERHDRWERRHRDSAIRRQRRGDDARRGRAIRAQRRLRRCHDDRQRRSRG